METQGSLDSCVGSPVLGEMMCGDAHVNVITKHILRQPYQHNFATRARTRLGSR